MPGQWVLVGWRALELKTQLADGEMTQAQLGEYWGVSAATIQSFWDKHKAEILKMREEVNDEFRGLWSAKKKNRIAEYEQTIALVDKWLSDDPASNDRSALILRKQNALKALAEELGQLDNKQHVIIPKLHVNMNGVSLDDLT